MLHTADVETFKQTWQQNKEFLCIAVTYKVKAGERRKIELSSTSYKLKK